VSSRKGRRREIAGRTRDNLLSPNFLFTALAQFALDNELLSILDSECYDRTRVGENTRVIFDWRQNQGNERISHIEGVWEC
jgi:hypothetical protein